MTDNKMTAEQALEELKGVLCDPEGFCCIDGSDGDRVVIDSAIETLELNIKALSAPRVLDGWVPIDDKLPEIGQLVALMDTGRYANMPDGLPDMHVTAVGFLNEFGDKYWSLFGASHSAVLHGFTHWMALPNVLAASPEPVADTELADLRAEVEALREDAERYRWIKIHSITDRGFCDWKLPDIEYQRDFDAAIDAARGGK